MASTKYIAHKYDDGKVFFYGETGKDAKSGQLKDEYVMKEEAITDYIRHENPDLFLRLRGMHFTSSDIPQSYYGSRLLHRALKTQESAQEFIDLYTQPDLRRDSAAYEISPSIHVPDQYDTKSRSSNEDVLLARQLARNIYESLIKGCTLILSKQDLDRNSTICGSPICASDGRIAPGSFRLSVSVAQSIDAPYMDCCLTCMEDIFDGRVELSPGQTIASAYDSATFLDGVNQEIIVETACRLSSVVDDVVEAEETPSPTDFAWKYPSTSLNALRLRREKQQEINHTLEEVAKYEASRRRSMNGPLVSPADPDLRILPVPYMEKSKDRYKKQGLGPWDKQVARQADLRERRASDSTTIDTERTLVNCLTERQCYCQEFDNGEEEMVKCHNEWCQIGWFHVRCVEVEPTWNRQEAFFCNYCGGGCDRVQVFAEEDPTDVSAIDENNTSQLSDTTSTSTLDPVRNVSTEELTGDESEEYDEKSALEDEWYESDCEEEQDTEDITLTAPRTPSKPWGTPINTPSTAHTFKSLESSQVDPDSPTLAPERAQVSLLQSDGLNGTSNKSDRRDAAVQYALAANQPTTDATPLSSISEPSTHDSQRQVLTAPPPAVPEPKFRDLAFFMTCQTLTELETLTFEDWKTRSKTASLLAALPLQHDQHTQIESGEHPERLSVLLARATTPIPPHDPTSADDAQQTDLNNSKVPLKTDAMMEEILRLDFS